MGRRLHALTANGLYDLQDSLLLCVYTDLGADVNQVYLKLAWISELTSPLSAVIYHSVTVQSETYLDLKKEVSAVEALYNNLPWNFLLIVYTLLMKLSVVF